MAWGSRSMAMVQQDLSQRPSIIQHATLVILVSVQDQYGQHPSSPESSIGQGAHVKLHREQPLFWVVLSLALAG